MKSVGSGSVSGSEPIAIVGIGCRLPGASSPDAFWQLLRDGCESVGDIPPNRFDSASLHSTETTARGSISSRRGGFLPDIDLFDASFFGISRREAELLDPQQRLLLEVAWETLEDAGIPVERVMGGATGVFLGMWINDFEDRVLWDLGAIDFYMTTGSGRYTASGRLSHTFGFKGPSLTIDTACSSSLVAIHLACQSIRSGESTIALAGGVNLILRPHISIAYSQSSMLSPDGRCKFADARADGYVRSEGVALVTLKSLSRAQEEGDFIYAVILGSAVNNDGHCEGSMGTPDKAGQEDVLRKAYRNASVSPGGVHYVEAHGTGTRAGDPVELQALGRVLMEGRRPGRRCLVGSVKGNIGHVEGAAGIAGLIKVALSISHREIPGTMHFEKPNPAIPWGELPLEVVRTLMPWPDHGTPLAGVSSFGIAGTNAHVVLTAAPPGIPVTALSPSVGIDQSQSRLLLLPISAKSREALKTLAARYVHMVRGMPVSLFGEMCATAAHRRTALEHRLTIAARTPTDCIEALEAFLHGESHPGVVSGVADATGRRVISFVFPGQGSQWPGMGQRLLATQPEFAGVLRECAEAVQEVTGWSVFDVLRGEQGSPPLDQIDVIQPVLFSIQIALARLLASWGVTPDAVVGHSMGEVAAAVVAGAMNIRDAAKVITLRSSLMKRTSGQGGMLLIEQSMVEAKETLRGLGDGVSIAVSNSSRSTVLSGDPGLLMKISETLGRQDVFCRWIKVDVASHSPAMEPLIPDLRGGLKFLRPHSGTISFFSTVVANRIDGKALTPEYWAKNLRQPVLFSRTVARMREEGCNTFLEISPHPVLLPSMEQDLNLGDKPALLLPSMRRGEDDELVLMESLGALFAHGSRIQWRTLLPEGANFRTLPTYPWQRDRFWPDIDRMNFLDPWGNQAEPAGEEKKDRHAATKEEATVRRWIFRPTWKKVDPPSRNDRDFTGSWILVGGTAGLRSALADCFRACGGRVHNEAAPIDNVGAKLKSSRSDAYTGLDDLRGLLYLSVSESEENLPESEQVVRKTSECIRFLQSVATADWIRRPRVWIFTVGGQLSDTADDRSLSPASTGIWGVGRVFAAEHPELWGGLVDLAGGSGGSIAVESIESIIGSRPSRGGFLLRGGEVYRFCVARPSDIPEHDRKINFVPHGAYLVSGGMGGVGFQLARWCAQNGARTLILLSRTALPERRSWGSLSPGDPLRARINAVLELEQHGCTVETWVADVSDESLLRQLIAEYRSEERPPIRGVIHAVGRTEDRLLIDLEPDAVAAVFQEKVGGAYILDRLLGDVEWTIYASSVSAVFAQPGQGAYAAANGVLDGLARHRSARGQWTMTVNWPIWSDIGMAATVAAGRTRELLASMGIGAITADQGVDVLSTAVRLGMGHCLVLPDSPGNHIPSEFLEEDHSTDGHPAAEQATTPVSPGLSAADLLPLAPEKRNALLSHFLRENLARVLKTDQSSFEPDRPFGSYGLASLMGLEFRNSIERLLGLTLPATIVWNYPTLNKLTAHLLSRIFPSSTGVNAARVEALQGGVTPPSPGDGAVDELAREVERLSEEEAAKALLQGKKQ